MVFFANAQMTIKAAIPSPVYQGSMNANEITLVAPVASDMAVVYARFILPNGIVSGMKVAGYPEKYTMTEVAGLPSLGIKDESGTPYRAWTLVMDEPLTEYAGEATVQFFVTLGDVTYSSASVSFVINEGTPVFSDENIGLTNDLYQELLAAFGGFRDEAAASAKAAADSATSAANSATSATSSATSAASSATVAEDSATAAALSEANASSSATAAALSEANASNSATAAAEAAQAAAGSAVASEASASEAAQSAEDIAGKKVFALTAYYAEEAETARGYTKGGKTDIKFRELEARIGSGGGGSPEWGNIGGTLSNQTDLKNALDLKANKTELEGLNPVSANSGTGTESLQTLTVGATTYSIPQGGGSGSEGTWRYIGKYTFGYSLTTSQPDDWETNFTNYYTKGGTLQEPEYTAITGETAPTWQENTYYKWSKMGNMFFSKEPDGTDFSFKKVRLLVYFSQEENTLTNPWIQFRSKNAGTVVNHLHPFSNPYNQSIVRTGVWYAEVNGGYIISRGNYSNDSDLKNMPEPRDFSKVTENITQIGLCSLSYISGAYGHGYMKLWALE